MNIFSFAQQNIITYQMKSLYKVKIALFANWNIKPHFHCALLRSPADRILLNFPKNKPSSHSIQKQANKLQFTAQPGKKRIIWIQYRQAEAEQRQNINVSERCAIPRSWLIELRDVTSALDLGTLSYGASFSFFPACTVSPVYHIYNVRQLQLIHISKFLFNFVDIFALLLEEICRTAVLRYAKYYHSGWNIYSFLVLEK